MVVGVDLLILLLIMGLAASAVSITVTRAKVFDQPRKWLKKKHDMLGYLLSCPYCFSHWVAIFLILTLGQGSVIWLIAQMCAVVGLSAIFTGLIFRLLLWQENDIEALNRELKESRDVINSLINQDPLT